MIQLWIDTETTGLDTYNDSIIQLACIVRVDNKETERHVWYMKPYRKNKVDPAAARAHGISQEQAESFPDQEIAFKEFNELLQKYKLNVEDKAYFCGYNSEFDLKMVIKWFEYNGRFNFMFHIYTPDFDVMRAIGIVFGLKGIRPYLPNFKLTTVYEALFKEPFPDAHDALADIDATIKIWDVYVKKYFPETLEN